MIFAIVMGVLLATGHAAVVTAAAIIAAFTMMRALWDIVFPKRFVSGTESPYVFYVQNLQAMGELVPHLAWLRYLAWSCVCYIPTGLVVYFVVRHFVS